MGWRWRGWSRHSSPHLPTFISYQLQVRQVNSYINTIPQSHHICTKTRRHKGAYDCLSVLLGSIVQVWTFILVPSFSWSSTASGSSLAPRVTGGPRPYLSVKWSDRWATTRTHTLSRYFICFLETLLLPHPLTCCPPLVVLCSCWQSRTCSQRGTSLTWCSPP